MLGDDNFEGEDVKAGVEAGLVIVGEAGTVGEATNLAGLFIDDVGGGGRLVVEVILAGGR